jgi:hypothetical protein
VVVPGAGSNRSFWNERDHADGSEIALIAHLRFAAAVMSTDNFAMKLAPHQLEPGAANGLIGVVAIPLAV